jgi:hypothetical protein
VNSLVHVAPVADANNEDTQGVVFDAADDAVIPDAIFSIDAKAGAFEGFADAARIVQRRHAFMQESQDVAGLRRVDLAELTDGGRV